MRSIIAALGAVALSGHVASALPVYLPNGGSVSYNGGGVDWSTTNTQLLNSVGSGAATVAAGTACAGSIQQSPINIVDKPLATKTAVYNAALPALSYAYPVVNGGYKVEMNEHTLEVKFDVTNYATAGAYGINLPFGPGASTTYLPATQLHFHSPSEHTINGVHYPLEMHIVNQVVTGITPLLGNASAGVPGSVIAIMFQYTPDNTANSVLNTIWSNAPSGLTFAQQVTAAASNQYASKNNSVENIVASAALDIGSLVLAADPTTYYQYNGSLTTPGCSTTIQFNVLTKPLSVSYAQVVAFTNLLAAAQGGMSRGADNRPINTILASTVVSMSKPNIAIPAAVSSAVAVRGVVGVMALAAAALLL